MRKLILTIVAALAFTAPALAWNECGWGQHCCVTQCDSHGRCVTNCY